MFTGREAIGWSKINTTKLLLSLHALLPKLVCAFTLGYTKETLR
jgi:hypothetical protein